MPAEEVPHGDEIPMKRWLKRARGALGMGLTWAVGWAIFGLLIGVSSILLPFLPWERFFEVFDAPLPALAVPGFFGGVIFSFVLGIAGRRRRFDELSLPRFAAWGAVGGLLLSLVPAAMVAVGLAHLGRPDFGLWSVTASISGPLILLSTLSASGSLMLARLAQGRRVSETNAELTELELAQHEAQNLLEGQAGAPVGHPAARLEERARPDRS
jgi:hypothetical protein